MGPSRKSQEKLSGPFRKHGTWQEIAEKAVRSLQKTWDLAGNRRESCQVPSENMGPSRKSQRNGTEKGGFYLNWEA